MRILFICCLSFFINTALAAGVFDVVRSLPSSQRIAKTQEIYNTQVKRKDSVFAIGSIKQLIAIANDLGDQSLHSYTAMQSL